MANELRNNMFMDSKCFVLGLMRKWRMPIANSIDGFGTWILFHFVPFCSMTLNCWHAKWIHTHFSLRQNNQFNWLTGMVNSGSRHVRRANIPNPTNGVQNHGNGTSPNLATQSSERFDGESIGTLSLLTLNRTAHSCIDKIKTIKKIGKMFDLKQSETVRLEKEIWMPSSVIMSTNVFSVRNLFNFIRDRWFVSNNFPPWNPTLIRFQARCSWCQFLEILFNQRWQVITNL